MLKSEYSVINNIINWWGVGFTVVKLITFDCTLVAYFITDQKLSQRHEIHEDNPVFHTKVESSLKEKILG